MKLLHSNQLFTILCMILGSWTASNAQISFSHAAGAGLYGGGDASSLAIVYAPRLNILSLGDNATVSIGTHAGAWLAFNSREGASSLALDLPLVAELNLGHKANKDNESGFGGFIGAGYGISRLASDSEFGVSENKAAGIVVNAGIRAGLIGQSFGLRVSYLFNMKDNAANVLGLGLQYNF
jgi:hypothetical protein